MNWKNILLIIILITSLTSLFRIVGKISDGKKRLAGVNKEVAQVLKQKDDVEREIKERESTTYLEREARNRLNLIKPGERVVILPKKADSAGSGYSPGVEDSAQSKPPEPNWVKWKRLFFN